MGGVCSGVILRSGADDAVWNGITYTQLLIKPNKKTKDASKCIITGITFLPTGEIILADHYNRKLKLFSNDLRLLSKLECACAPYDVCVSTKGAHSVFTTLTAASRILTVSTDYDALEADRWISTHGPCFGISCFRDYIFVVVKHVDEGWQVRMLDFAGEVKRTFVDDHRGTALFDAPRYVEVNRTGTHLFVSDVGKQQVICINAQNGSVRFVYKDTSLETPSGLTKDNQGHMYVLGCNPCSVHQVTEDGSKVEVVLGKSNRLPKESTSGAICYGNRAGLLAVAVGEETQMKLFHMT